MKVRLKKALSLLLALVMSLGCMSIGAWADVVEPSDVNAVANTVINGVTSYYDNLNEAFQAAIIQTYDNSYAAEIHILKDVDLEGSWVSYGAITNVCPALTIYGNDHTISNLSAPLIKELSNGQTTLSISNLTISNSTIYGSTGNGIQVGAFIGYMGNMNSATFDDCHVKSSIINAEKNGGGLYGYASDLDVTITNCSVEGCTIDAPNGCAGIIAGDALQTRGNLTMTGTEAKDSVANGEAKAKTGILFGRLNNANGKTCVDAIESGNSLQEKSISLGQVYEIAAVLPATSSVEFSRGGSYTVDPLQKASGAGSIKAEEGYSVVSNGNGGYTIGVEQAEPAYVAQIGNVGYASLAAAVEAANETDDVETITILSDFTIDANKTQETDRIVITKPVTINFGEYTMSVPGLLEPTSNWAALYVDADTTIEATTGGIDCLDNGSDPGVYGFTVRNGAKLTINGGSYHGGGTIVQAQQGTAEINDGYFSFTPFEEPYGSKFALNCIDAAHNNGVASISVKGGEFKNVDPSDIKSEPTQPLSIVADGYMVTSSTSEDDTIYTVVPAVAQIGTTKFATLEAAFAAAQDGDTITVLADCAGNGIQVAENRFTTGLTVDMNSHTYTLDGNAVGSAGTKTSGFQLIKNNKITFKDGTIKIYDGNKTGAKFYRIFQNYSDLTLNNMVIDGTNIGYSWEPVSFCNGTISIIDSQIKAPDSTYAMVVGCFSNYTGGRVTVTDSTINGDIRMLEEGAGSTNCTNDNRAETLALLGTTTAGRIVLDDQTGELVERMTVTKASTATATAPAGYAWSAAVADIQTLTKVNYVAQIGETKYATLAATFAAAEDGDTIELLANVTLDSEIEIADGSAFTLALGENNITTNGCSAFQISHGSLEITGSGTISGSPSNYKMIYLKGSTTSTDEEYSNLVVGEGVTVSCANGYAVMVSHNSKHAYGVNVQVDGTVEGLYGGLYVNGYIQDTEGIIPAFWVSEGATVRNTSMDYSSLGGFYAIYAAGYADWVVDGATIVGGVEIKSGSLTVYDGEFTALGEEAHTPNGNGTSTSGYAIAAVNNSGYAGYPEVVIYDGTFTGKVAIADDDNNADNNTAAMSIMGGSYSVEPETAYLATGFGKALNDVTNNYDVTSNSYINWNNKSDKLIPLVNGMTVTNVWVMLGDTKSGFNNGTIESEDFVADGMTTVEEMLEDILSFYKYHPQILATMEAHDVTYLKLKYDSITIPSTDAPSETPVCTVGGTEYYSIKQAVDAIAASESKTGEIVMTANYTTNVAVEIPTGVTVTLDLAGHNLSAGMAASNRHLYAIENYGTFTLKDTASSGSINARGIENYENGVMTINGGTINALDGNGGAAIFNEGDLTVENGVFNVTAAGDVNSSYGAACLSNQKGATATIKAGTFNSINQRAYAIINSGTMTVDEINGAVTVTGTHGGISCDYGTLTVNGGTFTCTNYYGMWITNNGNETVVTINGGSFTGGLYGLYATVDDGKQDKGDVTISITGGSFKGGTAPALAVKKGSSVHSWGMTITGGKFSSEPDSDYINTGYKMVANTDDDQTTYPYKVVEKYTEQSTTDTSSSVTSTTTVTNDTTTTTSTGFAVDNTSDTPTYAIKTEVTTTVGEAAPETTTTYKEVAVVTDTAATVAEVVTNSTSPAMEDVVAAVTAYNANTESATFTAALAANDDEATTAKVLQTTAAANAIAKAAAELTSEQTATVSDAKVILKTELKSFEASTTDSSKAKKVTYDITPVAQLYNSNSEPLGDPVALNNEDIKEGETFTFSIPVPSNMTAEKIKVSHIGTNGYATEIGNYTPDGDAGQVRYVTVTVDHFSEFELEEATVAVLGTAKVAANLSLQDEIKINFKVHTLSDNPSNYSVKYKFGNGDEVSKALTEADDIDTTGGIYKFVVASCAAKQMTDTVSFKLYCGDTEIFSYVYSIRQYCVNKINANSDAKLVALCRAILDYGAEAQTYFGYKTDALANADSYGNGGSLPTIGDNYNRLDASVTSYLNGITKVNANLTLVSNTELNFKLTADDVSKITGVSVSSGNETVSVTTSTSGDVMTIKVNGIAAKYLDHVYTLSFNYDSEANSIQYSPLTYAYRNQNKTSDNLGSLCKALYQYWYTAQAYLN